VGMHWGVEGIALGVMIAGFGMLSIGIGVLVSTLDIPLARFAAVFWRPTASALVMAVVVHFVAAAPWPPLPRLFACIALGAVTYGVALAGLWWLAGRPPGVEKSLLDALVRRRRARE